MPLQKSDLSDAVINTYYAVRGPIVARAQQLEQAGKEIIYCNIGNPQALKQKPLTYVRNTLAACEQPGLLNISDNFLWRYQGKSTPYPRAIQTWPWSVLRV